MSAWFVLGGVAIGALVGFVAGVIAGTASNYQGTGGADADRGGLTREDVEEIVARRLHPTSQPPRWN
jgi:hypothetical protein